MRRRRRRAVTPTSNTANHDYHEKSSWRVSIGMGLCLAALRAAGAPLLIFTEQAKKSYLTKALYYKDTARHMDEVDNTADNNHGLVKRATFTNNGAEVGLVGVPLCDVFNMDKLLLDGL